MPKHPAFLWLAAVTVSLATFAPRSASAWDAPQQRTVSASKQFFVYCDNPMARGDIASFADKTKQKLLTLLGLRDQWKYPIVINIITPTASQPASFASRVGLYDVDGGFKVQLDVSLAAEDASAVRFQQQLLRALLLELAYRDQPGLVKGGTAYAEPPSWLIEGAAELFRSRESGTNTDIFKNMLKSGRLPTLNDFLREKVDDLDTTSRDIYAGCAMSLVQLLTETPDSRGSLVTLIKRWPGADGDSFGEVIKRFPALGADTPTIEKWWTLGLAHLSASERYAGYSLQETEQHLAPLLSFEIPINKTGETKLFSLEQFEEFRKLPANRAALNGISANLMALGAQSSAMLRPVIFEYQKIAADLARGKTHGIKERLLTLAQYRDKLTQRMDDIADCLNWYEATQISKRSKSFDDYLQAANSLLNAKPKRDDGITRYLDEVEEQLDN